MLLIEDTSELNYQSHAGRTRGLGTVGNGKDAGLFIHPVLCVDADDGACLGLAHLHLWQRTKKKAANYRSQPIEDKERALEVGDVARRVDLLDVVKGGFADDLTTVAAALADSRNRQCGIRTAQLGDDLLSLIETGCPTDRKFKRIGNSTA